MFQITAIIATLNEERNIARCIESLIGVVDEIIVVDSYSTDRTKEICLSLGVRFMKNKWPGYAAQKNFAQQQATYDYIISLDADEAISETLAASIRKIKNGTSFHLYSFNRLTNYCGKWIRHCGWYPDVKLRVYDRRNCHWDGNVHEWLVYPASENIIHLEGDLIHYSFYTLDEHKAKAKKYAALGAERIIRQKKKFLLLRMIFNPAIRFFRMYIVQLGFLDGYYGLMICLITSGEVFGKYRLAAFSNK